MPQSNNTSSPQRVYREITELDYIPIEDTYISTREFRAKLKKAKGEKNQSSTY